MPIRMSDVVFPDRFGAEFDAGQSGGSAGGGRGVDRALLGSRVADLPFGYIAWQVGQEIGESRVATQAAQERARVLPPPPPLWMTDEDEPPLTTPTDTAGRPTQSRIRVAPEGGESIARPTSTTPTTLPGKSDCATPSAAAIMF